MANIFLFAFLVTVIVNDVAYGYGQLGTPEEFNYLASIWYGGQRSCTGAIISAKHILTTKKCATGARVANMKVYAGHLQITDSTPFHLVRSTLSYPPEEDDIAILELASPLTISSTVLTLPISRTSGPDFPTSCTLALFRGSNNPRDLSIYWSPAPITSATDCTSRMPKYFRLLPNEVCVFNSAERQPPYMGDNGAPVVCGPELLGVVASGIPTSSTPAKVLLVAPYYDWIKNIIKN